MPSSTIKYGGADARLSFHEFKRGFRPLILFQIGHLKENLKEMEREEKREQLRTTYVRNKSKLLTHDGGRRGRREDCSAYRAKD